MLPIRPNLGQLSPAAMSAVPTKTCVAWSFSDLFLATYWSIFSLLLRICSIIINTISWTVVSKICRLYPQNHSKGVSRSFCTLFALHSVWWKIKTWTAKTAGKSEQISTADSTRDVPERPCDSVTRSCPNATQHEHTKFSPWDFKHSA